MDIFSGDKSIYGKYAQIIKKYSRSSDADAEEWKVSNGEESPKPFKIFSTYVDCLFAGASIGLAKGLKINEESSNLDKKMRANILAAAWKGRQIDFMYLYRLMILTDQDLPMSKDERVKKACGGDNEGTEEIEFNYFLSFAYGGLVEMDRMFSEVHDYSSASNLVSELYLELKGPEEE